MSRQKSAVHVDRPVPRNAAGIKESDVGSYGVIPISMNELPIRRGVSLLSVEEVSILQLNVDSLPVVRGQDLLWMCGVWLHDTEQPSWSVFMDTTSSTSNIPYETSAVMPLTFVNLDPINSTTIYTCLLYTADLCRKHNQSNCIVTFDQPLYAKSMNILLASENDLLISSVTVRLGVFHLLMSFMGATGTIMAGSGIKSLWETVYSANTVVHMMTGHA